MTDAPTRISLAEVARARPARLLRARRRAHEPLRARCEPSAPDACRHHRVPVLLARRRPHLAATTSAWCCCTARRWASLRRELIDSLGLEKRPRPAHARGLRQRRARRATGARALARAPSRPRPFMAGTRLHALEGVVKVEPVAFELRHRAAAPTRASSCGTTRAKTTSTSRPTASAPSRPAGCRWAMPPATSPACSAGWWCSAKSRAARWATAVCRVIGKIGASAGATSSEDMRYLQARDFRRRAAVPASAPPQAARAAQRRRAATGDAMVGASSAFNSACHLLHRVAPTQATVLFTGESGVGKEMFASMLHRISPRARQALRRGELRGHPGDADRVRAVRRRARRLHRRRRVAARALRARRRRHAVPRRDRHAEPRRARASCCAPCRKARSSASAARAASGSTCASSRPPTSTCARRCAPGGSATTCSSASTSFPIHLPPLRERRDDMPLLMNHFLQHYEPQARPAGRRLHAARGQGAAELRLPRQHPRAAEPDRARRDRRPEGGLIEVQHLFTSGERLDKNVLSVRPDGHLAGAAGARPPQASPANRAVPEGGWLRFIGASGRGADTPRARAMRGKPLRGGARAGRHASPTGLPCAQARHHELTTTARACRLGAVRPEITALSCAARM